MWSEAQGEWQRPWLLLRVCGCITCSPSLPGCWRAAGLKADAQPAPTALYSSAGPCSSIVDSCIQNEATCMTNTTQGPSLQSDERWFWCGAPSPSVGCTRAPHPCSVANWG